MHQVVPSKKMKFFSDRAFLPAGLKHTQFLAPFWGALDNSYDPLLHHVYKNWQLVGLKYAELAPLDECDFTILPFDWYYAWVDPRTKDLAFQFIQKSWAAGKVTVIFAGGDGQVSVDLPGTIVVAYNLYHSRRRPNEYASPLWTNDPVPLNGKIVEIARRENPSVGFCGFATPIGQKWGVHRCKAELLCLASAIGLGKSIPHGGKFAARARAVRSLQKSKKVKADLIVRNSFSFDQRGVLVPGGPDRAEQFRSEFLTNLRENEYALCVRGGGNASIRFYEALASGRIPVLVNTDCVLPFDTLIPWKKHVVWVEESDIPKIPDKIIEFNMAHSAAGFLQLQHANRQLWKEWLAPEAFFSRLGIYVDQWQRNQTN